MMPSRAFRCAAACLLASLFGHVRGEIPKPADAPRPLSPQESHATFRVPAGLEVQLVASEPLVQQPSGVCWDAKGRLFVSELHGYNLEGQFDIEELNKTGRLDTEVRRIAAPPEAKKKAAAETYGTIKLLEDGDGDGVMDKATVFADRLPACHGICPALDGIIATADPQIIFLADRDGDGVAEVREVLFDGFTNGILERSISQPQWGHDDWIYAGAGSGGGRITGPRLAKPVDLPKADFRFQADGSAIEPLVGSTHTFGITLTDRDEKKHRSANVTSASDGRAGRITRSNSRNRSGWMRPDRGGAEVLPVHAQHTQPAASRGRRPSPPCHRRWDRPADRSG